MANETIIIGLPWLKQFNPQIDWVKSTINIPREKLLEVQQKSAFELASRIKEAGIRRRLAKKHVKRKGLSFMVNVAKPEDRFDHIKEYWWSENMEKVQVRSVWIRAKVNPAMEMAQQENATKEARTKEEIVPQYLHEFLDRFDKKEAERFPESRPYDHAIDTKPDFIPKDCKVYPLSPKEQEALDEFLEENLPSSCSQGLQEK